MREILFRGKRIDTGEWVEGDLIQLHDGRKYIVNNRFGACIDDKGNFINTEEPFVCQVDPDTISQFAGRRDKNRKRIFESDIVEQNWYDYTEPVDDSFGIVTFCEDNCSFAVIDVEGHCIKPLGENGAFCWEAEVIGNIHDNPELPKEEKE